MKTETRFPDLEIIEIEDSAGHQHTMGFAGCTKCDCTAYNPATTGGKCQSSDGKGGTCNHKYDDHKS